MKVLAVISWLPRPSAPGAGDVAPPEACRSAPAEDSLGGVTVRRAVVDPGDLATALAAERALPNRFETFYGSVTKVRR